VRRLVPAQSKRGLFPAYHQQTISAVHRLPVVFIGIATNDTDLIVLSIVTESWPSKPMGAKFSDEPLQECHVCPSLSKNEPDFVASAVLKVASESI
jgi:hypothetical protein